MNSFHITARVPPEILTMVCSYLATEEGPFSASQVCRRWRRVLVSSPSLWTRLPCDHVIRTTVSLERCKPMPIHLWFSQKSLSEALREVLMRVNKVVSLDILFRTDRLRLLNLLFTFSEQDVERLHICREEVSVLGVGKRLGRKLWRDLPSIRELFVCRYPVPFDQLTAPNLTHLALDEVGSERPVAAQTVLDTLRGCPLLETLFLTCFGLGDGPGHPPHDRLSVSLPHLRSIELGADEFRSLIPYLLFPQNVAVGFRMRARSDVWFSDSLAKMAAMQHVLGRIDVRSITIAFGPTGPYLDGMGLLVRFEGYCGSLEITYPLETDAVVWNAFFGPGGALYSQRSSRLENVRELHIIGNFFGHDKEIHHIQAAIPNLVSVSFFRYEGSHVFGLLAPTDPSSPPFPRLERVMVLGPESGLREVVKARRDNGVPLKTLVVGRGSDGRFEDDREEDYATLGEFVEDLRIGCPTEIVEWGAENEIIKFWSAVGVHSPVSPNGKLKTVG